MRDASIKVTYWVIPEVGEKMVDLMGADVFKKSLSASYVAVVQPKRGDCGGGLYELTVSFVTSISIVDVAKFISGGIAYDMIKAGADSFMLKPFLNAYKTLKETSVDRNVDIYELRINFLDCELIITKVVSDSVFEQLEKILHTFATHYKNLLLSSGAPPYEIHMPILEDIAHDRLCRFRSKLDVDENIKGITNEAYFKYWGLVYNNETTYRIYDVEKKLLIDHEFLTQDQYWQRWERKWARENAKTI